MTKTKRKKTELNGRFYRAAEDKALNKYQVMHMSGYFDVNAPIPQEDGGEPLPPLSQQWKEDMQRRFNVKNRSRNR